MARVHGRPASKFWHAFPASTDFPESGITTARKIPFAHGQVIPQGARGLVRGQTLSLDQGTVGPAPVVALFPKWHEKGLPDVVVLTQFMTD
jgi:hypothetical protein